MGTIALITKDDDTFYNGIKIYEGAGGTGACGWGVRDRGAGLKGVSVVSLLHAPPGGVNLKYASFYVDDVSVPATDYLTYAIWSYNTGTPNSITLVTSGTIDADTIEDQYGTGEAFTAGTMYTIELDSVINIVSVPGTAHYVSVYTSGLETSYSTDGVTDGAYYYTGNISDISNTHTMGAAGWTLGDYAVSFELFTEPNAWNELDEGGSIQVENTEWQDLGAMDNNGWLTPTNLYEVDAAIARTPDLGDDIAFDLAFAGADPPDAWPRHSTFPDYETYGVRAVSKIVLEGLTFPATDTITIQINDGGTDTAPEDPSPVTGWQAVAVLDSATADPFEIYVSSIARWVRLVHTGTLDDGAIDIDCMNVFQIQYPIASDDAEVSDNYFYVDVDWAQHHVWVENYPTELAIRKASVRNMAGAESSPGRPFTNRMNID